MANYWLEDPPLHRLPVLSAVPPLPLGWVGVCLRITEGCDKVALVLVSLSSLLFLVPWHVCPNSEVANKDKPVQSDT